MTRAEHLQWAKDRANEYVDMGDLSQAFASLASDLSKHPELFDANQLNSTLGAAQLFSGMLDTPEKMRRWIEGFN